jgi:spore maturation protein CgeB
VNPTKAASATTYASDRMWMVILGGGFYLGARTPGVDRMLLDGVHCGWYSNLGECIQLTRRYLADRKERERVRAAGEAFVRTHHTYDQRVEHLLSGDAFTGAAG